MISEYFVRKRLDRLYIQLGEVWNEIQKLKAMGLFDAPEYMELYEEYDVLLERVGLLEWVLGEEEA